MSVPDSEQIDRVDVDRVAAATSDHWPSFRRVADPPDRGELLTALTTEHFTLQGARSQTMSESFARAALYIGAVSSTELAGSQSPVAAERCRPSRQQGRPAVIGAAPAA
jgi:hypothetical protein